MSHVVRPSKYRHIFGTPNKRENCYDNVKPAGGDSNLVKCGREFFAVTWESGGGLSLGIVPYSAQGKLNPNMGMVAGHKAPIQDHEWSPFIDNLIGTASEDGYAKLWSIPREGLGTKNLTDSVQTLTGHKRKVTSINFHPTANNVLVTASTDLTLKVWDFEKGETKATVEGHGDLIQSVAWNYNGSAFATCSKDKKLRIVDPRTGKVTSEAEAHLGVKASRVTYLGRKNKIFTVGFSKSSEREYAIWDPSNLAKPLIQQSIDSAAGLIMPFYDDDTGVLFLAGKGDGNIRYYEIVDEDPYIHYLNEYKSGTPQRGMGYLPKTSVNVSECEIVRLYKLAGNLVEPISFKVPRKSDMFQEDLFPDTPGNTPALTSDEWFAGQDANPILVSLAPGFQQKTNAVEFNPVKSESSEEGPKNERELREEYEKLKKRVAFLEAELVKKDQKIKELEK